MTTQSREQGRATMRHDTNEAAGARYVDLTEDITMMLARITKAADGFWGIAPEDVRWDHVGSLTHVRELLQNVIDFQRIK